MAAILDCILGMADDELIEIAGNARRAERRLGGTADGDWVNREAWELFEAVCAELKRRRIERTLV